MPGCPIAGMMVSAEVEGAVALLDVWLDAHREYGGLPGVSVAVVLGGDTVWSKGYGYANVQAAAPCTADTLFSICSISKLFTSIAVMQLPFRIPGKSGTWCGTLLNRRTVE